jgi:sporulation integral membrane protein YtvI
MEFLPKEPYKKIFYVALYTLLAVLGAYFFFEYAFAVALPFIISFFIACSVQNHAEALARRIGVGKRALSLVLCIFWIVCVSLLIFLCVSKLWQELYSFVRGFVSSREDILESARGISDKINSLLLRLFPDTDAVRESISSLFEKGVGAVISAVTTKLPALMGKIFSQVPKIIFFLAAMFISCIYFCLDFDAVCDFFRNLLSKSRFAPLVKLPKTSFRTIVKYIRASFIIFLIIFALLAVGFLIIGADYAWLMAAVTAFIDMLPFLGSGAVLLPYALLTIVSGRLGMGVGILIIWGTVSLVRQIIEPKIMGKNLGVHPLVNIAAVYAGYMFFGVTGVIFLPITVVIIKNLFSERVK